MLSEGNFLKKVLLFFNSLWAWKHVGERFLMPDAPRCLSGAFGGHYPWNGMAALTVPGAVLPPRLAAGPGEIVHLKDSAREKAHFTLCERVKY